MISDSIVNFVIRNLTIKKYRKSRKIHRKRLDIPWNTKVLILSNSAQGYPVRPRSIIPFLSFTKTSNDEENITIFKCTYLELEPRWKQIYSQSSRWHCKHKLLNQFCSIEIKVRRYTKDFCDWVISPYRLTH